MLTVCCAATSFNFPHRDVDPTDGRASRSSQIANTSHIFHMHNVHHESYVEAACSTGGRSEGGAVGPELQNRSTVQTHTDFGEISIYFDAHWQ